MDRSYHRIRMSRCVTELEWIRLRCVFFRVPPGHGKSWNLGRPFSRPGKSWKIAKIMESHGK